MSLIDIGAVEFPRRWAMTGSSAFVLDAAGEQAAMIVQVPKTGNIAKVGFRTGAVTVTDALAVNLETVNAATGAPTGTAYKGAAAGTVAVPAASTMYTVTLATPATGVVQGDTVAVVVSFPAYVAGNLQVWRGGAGSTAGLPYGNHYAAATWSKVTNAPLCWLEYDDGSYSPILGVFPGNYADWAYKQDTAGADEYGLLFTAPCYMRVSGWWGNILPGAASEVVLYSGTTELTKAVLDNDITQETGVVNQMLGQFPTSVDLMAGQQYRITLRPSDGVANSNLYNLETPSAAAMAAMPMGTNAYATKRLNLGAWTDLPTYRPQLGVVASHVDDAAQQRGFNRFTRFG